jgi:hypothetical protein
LRFLIVLFLFAHVAALKGAESLASRFYMKIFYEIIQETEIEKKDHKKSLAVLMTAVGNDKRENR